MNKLRLSYTLLHLWELGKTDEAIRYYLKLERYESEAMKRGKSEHKRFEQEIMKNKKLTFDKTTFTFDNPEVEKKVVVNYKNRYDIVSVFDCVDRHALFEWKTGRTPIGNYTKAMQVPLYFLVAAMAEIPLNLAYIVKTDICQVDIVHNNTRLVQEAENYVETLAPEILSFFKEVQII
jgi:hypothetical protein